ncbi:unnamed protein product [Paramecium octaurelia]|uniref:methionine--tRNA ligase n=1 Tax=Paramecium octaurelia TaxID=43137 RepID=A0A8S1U353_PAROT|nr:unnamed protein product [Paramecium octaurelia]
MIFAFKKLSGKTLSVLSILKILHLENNIQVKLDFSKCCDTLQINENDSVYGNYSIINYLSKVKRNPYQNERLWWIAHQLKEVIQIKKNDVVVEKKKQVKTDNIKTLNKILEQSKYLEGEELSETDIIAYIKLKRVKPEVKTQGKLLKWQNTVGAVVDPILTSMENEFKPQITAIEEEKKKKEEEIKRRIEQHQNSKKDSKGDSKKGKQEQELPKQQKQQQQQQQQPQQKEKGTKQKEEISQDYLKQFGAQKILRTNLGQQILPQKGKRNVLITSALPYVNNVPHLGNIIGCVLSADTFARYSRLRGYNTLYVCGTDEYGTATEVKAIQENMTPQQICTKYFEIHKNVYDWFDIDFDYFGRTSTPVHTEITQEIFNHLHPKYTTQKTTPQTFCSHCKMYLADRYVSGTCPHCQYDDARGDQCDSCGKLLDPVELINSKCYICKNKPEIKDTKHIYINLPEIQERLEKWIHSTSKSGQWSQNSYNVSKAWLKLGLKERCITRDLKWGVQVPLEEYKDKVFYVWFDAPIGYLSITANFIKDWKQWWMNPENVELFQFMGKDNVPFHTVIFPSTLMGTGQDYTLLKTISTTEYLNYEDGKFSKSRGTGVFGDNAQNTQIPNEIFRYYLLANRPEKSDTVFTWNDFANKNNNELLPNLGNLVNRALNFIYKNYNKAIPQVELNQLTPKDEEFINLFLNKFKTEYLDAFEKVEIKDALRKAMELSSLVNKYIQDEKAWEKEQKESKRSDVILFVAANAIRFVSALVEPFMPSVSAKINFTLGFNQRTEKDDKLFEHVLSYDNNVSALLNLVKPGQPINQPVPIFREFKPEEIENWRQQYKGQQ